MSNSVLFFSSFLSHYYGFFISSKFHSEESLRIYIPLSDKSPPKHRRKSWPNLGFSFWHTLSLHLLPWLYLDSISLHPFEELVSSYQCLFNLLVVSYVNRCMQPLILGNNPVLAFRTVQLPSLSFCVQIFVSLVFSYWCPLSFFR